jgi:hypothetical protein
MKVLKSKANGILGVLFEDFDFIEARAWFYRKGTQSSRKEPQRNF